MFKEKSLNTLACQKRGNAALRHKMLLQADMKVPKEWKKLLSRGKTKDTLASYYTIFIIETAKINGTETNTLHRWLAEGQSHQSDLR